LALSDVQIQVDQAGIPTGLERHEYDITHQMVEEFMLKANEVVAAHLTKQGKPVAYRIHEAPGDADLKEFVATARALGFRVPMPPTNSDLQALFAMAKDSAHAPQLAVSFIKSMKLAYYSPDNIGHYGLGLEHYCHFTSPIRRYSDLIAQRALFGELEADLAQMTEACSEQERRSSRAEESVVRLKKLRLLQQWLLDEPMRAFPAIITRVKPNGISFELPDLMLEGFLHVRELGDDFYHFQERRMAFVGEHTGETYAYGQTISVQVLSVDLLTGNLSWALAHSLVDAPLDEYMAETEASGDGDSGRSGARKRRSKKSRGKRRGPRA
jgi:ribonuclease R